MHGVDLPPGMLRRARREVAVAGLANVEFHEADVRGCRSRMQAWPRVGSEEDLQLMAEGEILQEQIGIASQK